MPDPQVENINLLANTPYLIGEDADTNAQFEKLVQKADKARELSIKAAIKVEHETREILDQYTRIVRSDLVSQSNIIEGYDWSREDVESAVLKHEFELARPVRDFLDLIKSDPKLYEALGLYRAYTEAAEWAKLKRRPIQSEIRELHQVIMGKVRHGGAYKEYENTIGGSEHVPPSPYDVPRMMAEMSDWWAEGSGNAVLDAAIVHAWITHIHPFEDGNGRMARILANMTLVNVGYPPFLIRSASDRLEYYEALAESDDGNILPLFSLFCTIMRRTAMLMLREDYAESQIKQSFLKGSRDKYVRWSDQVEVFFDRLNLDLRPSNITIDYQSTPGEEAFSLMQDRRPEGNSWAAIMSDSQGGECLLWHGYVGNLVADQLGEVGPDSRYPSLYLSFKNTDPNVGHRFAPRNDENDNGQFFHELHIRPLERHPVTIRTGNDVRTVDMPFSVKLVAQDIKKYFRGLE